MSQIHDRLDWNLLRTFLAIVQEGSISRAAVRLHLTQPAVSLALKRLEERLGENLIARSGSSFTVTTAGELVYKEALAIYGSIARLSLAVQDIPQDLTGVVRLAVVSAVKSDILDSVLSDFHQAHPRVTFEMTSGSSTDVQHALLHFQAALGVSLNHKEVPGLDSTPLLHQTYFLYCGKSHPLFGKTDLQIEALQNENFVSFASEQLDGVLASLAVYRAQQSLNGCSIGTSSSLHEVTRMIRAGLGIGALPEHVVAEEAAAGHLWKLPPYEGIATVTLHLMWNASLKINKAEEAFLACLRKNLTRAGY
ncbi:LysR family transcriptional regulator [Klebsiella quasipneumoniae subsp. similipneumoniae]|jgi:DNA-binding transcriptional LysR family regulator|uniref:LysR family transcriptional regulator n=1 Tax=Klebsiella pneumoniae complex TaxID=3390273 RepID=UPI000652495B|nr:MULTISPECIES: LysR family transcriptional regulator [Klebsiella]MDU4310895.1 LysR family transcriptional regulator [Klebsiella michiganensis]HBB4141582.1 LysR family transcriptional regulator [Escherichia coli]EKU0893426.1 LysR family transcriptional regulator [Klebsiella pneumoniae]EKU1044723.1 LysR family transcriptional regulator [Klebsiella pneumoniae]EKW3946621.1 LysR family transcriptional regulator [Klebsiella pneumoniae]